MHSSTQQPDENLPSSSPNLYNLRTISVVMADSGDHSQIASGESSESAMSVRSAELSACLKCVYLSVCINPLAALPLLQFENLTNCHTADAGAHHDTHHSLVGGPSAGRSRISNENRDIETIPAVRRLGDGCRPNVAFLLHSTWRRRL